MCPIGVDDGILGTGGEGAVSGIGASVGVAANSDSIGSSTTLFGMLPFNTSLDDSMGVVGSASGGKGAGGGEGGAASVMKFMLMRLWGVGGGRTGSGAGGGAGSRGSRGTKEKVGMRRAGCEGVAGDAGVGGGADWGGTCGNVSGFVKGDVAEMDEESILVIGLASASSWGLGGSGI